jgi:hypothetical protein
MGGGPVFFAFLAPFASLIVGLALVTFSALKEVSQPAKLLLTGLCVGGITALGWTPILSTGTISKWAYLGVVGISFIHGILISLLTYSETVTEKMIDAPTDKSLRDQYNFLA